MPRFYNGVRSFKFWLCPQSFDELLTDIDNSALLKNEKPLSLSFFPGGDGNKPKPMAKLSKNNVQISAIKKGNTGDKIVVRLYEPIGRSAKTQLILPVFDRKLELLFNPFEIKTVVYDIKKDEFKITSLMEK